MMCSLSLYIYIPSSFCTLQFNFTSVIFTLNLKSLFPKVKLPPETLLHFLHPYASIGGYFFTMSWSPPLWTSPPFGLWQANKCPTSHSPIRILKPQADDQGGDLPRALMLHSLRKNSGTGGSQRTSDRIHKDRTCIDLPKYSTEQILASCRFIVKSTFSQCPKDSD